ncbi:hypothetical protein BC629DRAFT_1473344 [Irpex lacteus]|nr:hypothetical protein BC629DRAFT_1473344 [Irpex lacteus]
MYVNRYPSHSSQPATYLPAPSNTRAMSHLDSNNYARFEGIYKSELAGAVIFAIAYAPLFYTTATYVLIMWLSSASVMRITAFVLRALIAGSDTAGRNLGCFFGLLYSAYTWEQMLGYEITARRIVRMKQVVRLTLIAAVTLGVVSGVCPQLSSNRIALRRASLYIFLVLPLFGLLTADLAWEEHGAGTRSAKGKIGNRYAALMLMRESFFVATVANILKVASNYLPSPISSGRQYTNMDRPETMELNGAGRGSDLSV